MLKKVFIKYTSSIIAILVLLLGTYQIVYAKLSVEESTSASTQVNQQIDNSSKEMYSILNEQIPRDVKIKKLIDRETKKQESLLGKEQSTIDSLKKVYGESADLSMLQTIKKLETITTVTRIRYSTATLSVLSMLDRVNKNIDDRENFGFDVKLEISILEAIETNLIDTDTIADSILFKQPAKKELSNQYISNETRRIKNKARVTQNSYENVISNLLELIKTIQNGK